MEADVQRFTRYLLNGDELSCEDMIGELPEKENVLNVFDLLTKSMQHIGELWENNEVSVADEHLATATCDYVLSQYRYRFITSKKRKETGKKAMFLCLEEEQHYLGTKIIASLFEYFGWEVRLFGANLPLEYAETQAKEWKPELIGVSVAILYHLPKLKDYVETLSRIPNSPTMMVGGRLSGLYDLRQYCSKDTVILKDIAEVKTWLEALSNEGISDGKRNQPSNSIFSN